MKKLILIVSILFAFPAFAYESADIETVTIASQFVTGTQMAIPPGQMPESTQTLINQVNSLVVEINSEITIDAQLILLRDALQAIKDEN